MTFHILIAASVCFIASGTSQAGGDPFYYSTWYAQPSSALAWSSQSVMTQDGPGHPFLWSGSFSPSSPRYFVPGYGYTLHRSFATSQWSAYSPAWSHGVLQPSSVSSGLFGTTSTFAPLIVSGKVHSPWYLFGSPGNSRSSLSSP